MGGACALNEGKVIGRPPQPAPAQAILLSGRSPASLDVGHPVHLAHLGVLGSLLGDLHLLPRLVRQQSPQTVGRIHLRVVFVPLDEEAVEDGVGSLVEDKHHQAAERQGNDQNERTHHQGRLHKPVVCRVVEWFDGGHEGVHAPRRRQADAQHTQQGKYLGEPVKEDDSRCCFDEPGDGLGGSGAETDGVDDAFDVCVGVDVLGTPLETRYAPLHAPYEAGDDAVLSPSGRLDALLHDL
mmetsp:Transcript_23746/g.58731  ORF Transcript_23746/g.58731 Transcript_23746/m.58731 type:complete len:239 (-) Transcript_23746:1474-2190(-)